jgi:lipopolysaccharide/colanic/teichoic acid biosynthesis glycosyltransferase
MNNGGLELAARLFDTGFALACLIVLSPLLTAAALLILLCNGRPYCSGRRGLA